SHTRLMQAIPFAMEEQINDELDQLHFAAGQFTPNEPSPVAVVARAKMSEWLDMLQAWQVTADEIIPAIFVVPCLPDSWSVMMNDVAVVRTGVMSGFACARINLPDMLQLALSSTDHIPSDIQLNTLHVDDSALSLSVPVHA